LSYLETLLVILRRWRISVPAVLLAFGAGGAGFFLIPPGYQDSTQVLFLASPITPGEKALSNPYLSMGSTLVSTADVIRLKVSTQQVTTDLAAAGARADYEVILDQSTPAPVLLVTTKDTDPAIARQTSLAVVQQIKIVLQGLQQQAGAPPATWVGSTVISSLPQPQRMLNTSLRPALVATVGVFAVTIFILFLLEGRDRRRSLPRTAATPPAEPQPARPQALDLAQAGEPQPSETQPTDPRPAMRLPSAPDSALRPAGRLQPRRTVTRSEPESPPLWRP